MLRSNPNISIHSGPTFQAKIVWSAGRERLRYQEERQMRPRFYVWIRDGSKQSERIVFSYTMVSDGCGGRLTDVVQWVRKATLASCTNRVGSD
jgi:hypothetical protein